MPKQKVYSIYFTPGNPPSILVGAFNHNPDRHLPGGTARNQNQIDAQRDIELAEEFGASRADRLIEDRIEIDQQQTNLPMGPGRTVPGTFFLYQISAELAQDMVGPVVDGQGGNQDPPFDHVELLPINNALQGFQGPTTGWFAIGVGLFPNHL